MDSIPEASRETCRSDLALLNLVRLCYDIIHVGHILWNNPLVCLFQTYASYRFYLDDAPTKTEMVAGSNPEYKHEKLFSFPVCTQSVSLTASS